MKILVTGASGYIGTCLIRKLRHRGHEVTAASRRPVVSAQDWIFFDLSSPEEFNLPQDTRCIIHLAANTTQSDDTQIDTSEHLAARHLIRAAQEASATFIFISSQTARQNAPTAYGKTKWIIEQEVMAAKGCVVRPGLVYGGKEAGLFGTLVKLVRQLPALPAFLPPPKVQPIHVDDLSDGLIVIAEKKQPPREIISLAEPHAISFTRFLNTIATHKLKSYKLQLPIPTFLIQGLIKVMGNQRAKRTGLNRLNSLFELPPMETREALQGLGLSLRSLPSGMEPPAHSQRCQLIREGRALLGYILKSDPSMSLMIRYVKAVERFRGGAPLSLPTWALNHPFPLVLLDGAQPSSQHGKELAWRLDMATKLAEATPQGAHRFLNLNTPSPFMTLISISRAVFTDTFWRIFRISIGPILRRVIHKTESNNEA